MIVPSIDVMDGRAVQLVGGRERVIDAGDPRPIAAAFGVVGEVAVVDLDAALGLGSNRELIAELCRSVPCRVGGGIRSVASARAWLDAGARSVVLGTAAVAEVLRELPRDRVVAALDAVDGEIVVDGWRTPTLRRVEEAMAELRPFVSGFLVTAVEREGRLVGIDLARAAALRAAAGDARLIIAGGFSSADEVAACDRLGIDAQVGMALYTGRFTLADCLAGMLRSDRSDGLWPTVTCDEHGVALGLAWSDRVSLAAALDQRRGIYHSRSRGLWVKGESSGARQDLLAVALDCDRDTLRFTVRQHGTGFCHRGTRTCWGDPSGLATLARRLAARRGDAPDGSYVGRLLGDPGLLAAKLGEEAGELAAARSQDEVIGEAADVLFFALVAMARSGVPLEAVEQELDRRALLVTRRPGNAKTAAPTRADRAVAAAEDPERAGALSGAAGGGS